MVARPRPIRATAARTNPPGPTPAGGWSGRGSSARRRAVHRRDGAGGADQRGGSGSGLDRDPAAEQPAPAPAPAAGSPAGRRTRAAGSAAPPGRCLRRWDEHGSGRCRGRRGGRHLRDPAGAQAGQRARHRPERHHRHRRGRPDPQVRRAVGGPGRRRAARPRPRLPSPRRRPSPRPPRRPAAPGPVVGAGRRHQRAARADRQAVPAAPGDRVPDGRVAADLRAADHRRRGGHHRHRPVARCRQAGLREAGGREAVLPAVLRGRGGGGAQGAPERQLLGRHRSRHRDLPRRRAPGHRGGHRARAAGAGDPQRR